MIRVVEYKLYPNKKTRTTLERWMGVCCWVYNKALEHRKKAYDRRGEKVSLYEQGLLLTKMRARMPWLESTPMRFERDALTRVDRGFEGFFRRLKQNEAPGYPRFKSANKYRSMTCVQPGKYLADGAIRIPCIGLVAARGRDVFEIGDVGRQLALRIIRKPSGLYAHIIFEIKPIDCSGKKTNLPFVGMDMGISSFATMSNGESIENPRFYKNALSKLKRLDRRLARRVRGSKRHAKALNRLCRYIEITGERRRSFSHKLSSAMIVKYQRIGVEKLDISNLVRTSRLSGHILDAAWGMFHGHLIYKAECAGYQVVRVDPRRTSQTCPKCQNVVRKKLSQRQHVCECGCILNRDHAAAIVIQQRAVASSSVSENLTPVEDADLAFCESGSQILGTNRHGMT